MRFISLCARSGRGSGGWEELINPKTGYSLINNMNKFNFYFKILVVVQFVTSTTIVMSEVKINICPER